MYALALIRTFQAGLKSLRLHKLRSALTMLGMIIGVGAVIALVAIGEGASHDAQEEIRALGARNVIIRSIKPPSMREQMHGAASRVPPLLAALPSRQAVSETAKQAQE